MPKKKADPVLKVLDYFKVAPLDAAKLALTLAAQTIQERMVEVGGPALLSRPRKVRTPKPSSERVEG